MASRMAWFLTPAGKKFSCGFTAVASLTVFSVQLAPHTYFLQKYKEVVSMYQEATPLPLSNDLLKRWNDTLNDLKISPGDRKKCEPFTVFGFDVFHAGSIHSSYGAIVGLPINFTYKSVDMINTKDILINHEPVDWERKEAKQLLEALVLSEDAQRYAIAREVLMVQNRTPLMTACINGLMFLSLGLLNRVLNRRYDLLERPLYIRGSMYFLTCVFTFGVWRLQVDTWITALEEEAEENIAVLGDRYIKGAIEFYEKMLKRNIALRSLLGSKGEDVYTSTGREKHLFRRPHIPINERLQFFKDHHSGLRGDRDLLHEKITLEKKSLA